MTILTVLVGACTNNQANPQIVPEKDTLRELVFSMSKELGEIGFPIDPTELHIEVKDASNMALLFNQINDKSRKDLELENASSKPLFRDGAEARLAFYDPNTKTIIFQKNSLDYLSRGYIAHELAHAYQDQKWGFDVIWKPYQEKPSRELYNITNYIVEGHAELARQAYEQERTKSSLKATNLSLSLGNMYHSECMLCSKHSDGDMASMPYAVGKRFLAHQYTEGGWNLVEKNLLRLPISSEQVLHPQKFKKDDPVELGLEPWTEAIFKVEKISDEVMGEAFLLGKLISLSIPAQEASLSASGWDGDIAHLYRTRDGEEVLLWRIVFDRELDAQQLENSLHTIGKSKEILKSGRVIDWVISDNAQLASRARIFMSRQPAVVGPEDSSITETAEQEQRLVTEGHLFNPYNATQIYIKPKSN